MEIHAFVFINALEIARNQVLLALQFSVMDSTMQNPVRQGRAEKKREDESCSCPKPYKELSAQAQKSWGPTRRVLFQTSSPRSLPKARRPRRRNRSARPTLRGRFPPPKFWSPALPFGRRRGRAPKQVIDLCCFGSSCDTPKALRELSESAADRSKVLSLEGTSNRISQAPPGPRPGV